MKLLKKLYSGLFFALRPILCKRVSRLVLYNRFTHTGTMDKKFYELYSIKSAEDQRIIFEEFLEALSNIKKSRFIYEVHINIPMSAAEQIHGNETILKDFAIYSRTDKAKGISLVSFYKIQHKAENR